MDFFLFPRNTVATFRKPLWVGASSCVLQYIMVVMERRWECPRKRRSGAPHCAVVYEGSCWHTSWHLFNFQFGWPPEWLLNVLGNGECRKKRPLRRWRMILNFGGWIISTTDSIGPSLSFCVESAHLKSRCLSTTSDFCTLLMLTPSVYKTVFISTVFVDISSKVFKGLLATQTHPLLRSLSEDIFDITQAFAAMQTQNVSFAAVLCGELAFLFFLIGGHSYWGFCCIRLNFHSACIVVTPQDFSHGWFWWHLWLLFRIDRLWAWMITRLGIQNFSFLLSYQCIFCVSDCWENKKKLKMGYFVSLCHAHNTIWLVTHQK